MDKRKPVQTVTISFCTLDEAMDIMDSKEETWENLKEFYPEYEVEYVLEVTENELFKIRALIYDKEKRRFCEGDS